MIKISLNFSDPDSPSFVGDVVMAVICKMVGVRNFKRIGFRLMGVGWNGGFQFVNPSLVASLVDQRPV